MFQRQRVSQRRKKKMCPSVTRVLAVLLGLMHTVCVADDAGIPASETMLPFRADQQLNPQEGVFVTISLESGYIFLSRDDGRTWKEVFVGDPLDARVGHGAWGLNSVCFTKGLAGVFGGWGATSKSSGGRYLGSVDGENWFHLAPKTPDWITTFAAKTDKVAAMPNAWRAAAGQDAFVAGGTTLTCSQDLGLTWNSFEPGKQANPPAKTHHLKPAYGDYDGGRFVVVGDGPVAFYSKDFGKTWQTGDISIAKTEDIPDSKRKKGDRYITHTTFSETVYGNGIFLFPVDNGQYVLRSTDGGETWTKHAAGAEKPASRGITFIDGEFWIPGGKPRASKDGLKWHDLPSTLPSGQFVKSDKGTYLCMTRETILRSTDLKTWESVFQAGKNGVGRPIRLRDIGYGYVSKVSKAD